MLGNFKTAPDKDTVNPSASAGASRLRKPTERILLKLKAITDEFPPDLRGMIAQPPAETLMIAMPIDRILDQLAEGRVQISIEELRRISPAYVFVWHASRDSELVEIPLREIVPKLDPSLLARLSSETLNLLQENERKEAEIPQLRLTPAEGVAQEPAMPPSLETEDGKPSPAPPINHQLAAPDELKALFAKPAGTGAPVQPTEVPPATATEPAPTEKPPGLGFTLRLETAPKLPPPEPVPEPPIAAPPTPTAPEPTSEFDTTELDLTEEMALAESDSQEPVGVHIPPAPVLPRPPANPSVVSVPFRAISGGWPDAIREEGDGLPLDAAVEFPVAELTAALKSGLVSFTWGQIRTWLVPRITAESMYDFALLNIPVEIVAPLLMASARQAGGETRGSVIALSHAAVEKAAAGRTAPPESRFVSGIVERARALHGVSGVVVADQDGLLLAANLPPELDANAVAAAVPQAFLRLNEITEPMRTGALQSVSFIAGDRPWQILQAGNRFIGAMGGPNEMLPTAQLKLLATQLARHVE